MNKKLLIVLFAFVLIFSISVFSAVPVAPAGAVPHPNNVIDISGKTGIIPGTIPQVQLSGLPKTINDKIGVYYKCFTAGKDCTGLEGDEMKARFEGECDLQLKASKGDNYESIVNSYSSRVPVNLIKAIITVESEWKPNAINGESYGIMQVNKGNLTGADLPLMGLTDVFSKWNDAQTNIERGTFLYQNYYLKEIEKKNCSNAGTILTNTGSVNADWKTACTIAAYNTGAGDIITDCTVIKYQAANPSKKIVASTEAKDVKVHNYTAAVLAWYRIFTENEGLTSDNPDYCKAQKEIIPVEPLIILPDQPVIVSCESCTDFQSCLACMDKKFIVGTFKAQ